MKALLTNLQKACFDASNQTVKAFMSNDVSSTENLQITHAKVDELSEEVEKAAKNQSFSELSRILAVANLLRRVYDLSVNLGELVG